MSQPLPSRPIKDESGIALKTGLLRQPAPAMPIHPVRLAHHWQDTGDEQTTGWKCVFSRLRQTNASITAGNRQTVTERVFPFPMSNRSAASCQSSQVSSANTARPATGTAGFPAGLREIARLSPDALFVWQTWPDGGIAFALVNEPFARLAGISAAELLDNPCALWEALPPEAEAALQETIRTATTTFSAMRKRFRLKSRLPEQPALEIHALPIRREKDGGTLWLGTLSDAAEDPMIERSIADDAALRSAFMEHSIDGIVIMDIETAGVVDTNLAFAEMLGYSPEELRRLHAWDWDARWSRGELEARFAKNDWPERFETCHRRKDGRVLDVAISATQISWQGRIVSFCVVKDITDTKLRQRQLGEELLRWKLLMERSNDGIVILDGASLAVVDVNPAFTQMLGYTRKEMFGMHPWDWDACFSRAEIEAMGTSHRDLAEERRFETCMRRKDGTLRDVEIHSTPAEMGEQLLLFCFCRDITARNQAERLLRAREQEFRSLAENSPDAIVRYDRRLHRLYVNPAFERLLGKERTSLLGRPLLSGGPLDLQIYKSALERVFETGVQQEAEVRHINADGTIGWTHPRFEPEFAEDGTVQSVLVVIRDVSDVVGQRELTQRLAFTDTLTGLPNRALFEKRFQDAAAGANLTSLPFALLMLDIDHFKDVNDTLGHKSGDELLRQVTARLSHCIRESDTIARLGGDEFAILQTHIHSVDDAADVASRLLDELAQPFVIDRQELFISGSIGIAFYPRDSRELNELFAFADTAMYSAKRKGRNNYQFYSRELTRQTTERLSIGSDLRHACTNNELQLLYQPKVLLETGRVTGVETLLRWRHPELGLLSPERFIPIAEENGLILDLGQWVLEKACRDAVRINGSRRIPLKVAVNLSCRQFVRQDLASSTENILNATGCLGKWLEFEITESLLIDDNPQVRKTLETLRALGVSIALDDFGTGYSALNYLTRFPMDVLKIDRSFTLGIDSDPRKNGLVKTFISLGKTLDMEIVAEGVETESQSATLRQLGCELGQGYLFGEPGSFEEFMATLSANEKNADGSQLNR
jgi:diguanylate cyclase (GGDEF)-like protein/PAS domain S-box-containing protein